MSKTRAGCLFLLFSFSIISAARAGTHSGSAQMVLRSYPMASSIEVPVETDIGISVSLPFGPSDATFIVTGSHSGTHSGTVRYSVDRATVIFRPSIPFDLHESVSVVLTAALMDGHPVLDSFSFQTVRAALGTNYAVPDGFESASGAGKSPSSGKFSGSRTLNTLGGMVDSVFNLNPTPGKVYISISGGMGTLAGLVILDENANLLNFDAVQGSDFLMQPNGEMTYYGGYSKYYGLDSEFNIVDSFGCVNTYTPDAHELIVQKNGGYTILGVTLTSADLSSVGGSPNAVIQGNVIQTFDKGGNLVFQWLGIDHYNVTDALGISFSAGTVDFEHANSIDIDSEGNYLLSNRHLSEVTKINGQTGDIIWRFGGKHNEFTSLNDTIGISYQHCARYLPNNHIMLFDNGNLHAVPVSRAIEFALNTSNMTDSVVWQFHHDPEVSTTACGSVQRMPNGNTFIGWGIQAAGPFTPTVGATEVQPDGTVVSDWAFFPQLFSYRAMKFPTPQASDIVTPPQPLSAGLNLQVSEASGGYDISFSTDRSSQASIVLYNLMGVNVANLFDGMGSTSLQVVHVSASSLPSGTYYVLLSTSEGRIVRPIALSH